MPRSISGIAVCRLWSFVSPFPAMLTIAEGWLVLCVASLDTKRANLDAFDVSLLEIELLTPFFEDCRN